jgi:hypothetical protein
MHIIASAVVGVLVTGFLSSSPLHAQQAPPAGYVKIVTGTASITRDGRERPARPGDAVFQDDRLRTGADGRLGVTLKDDTRLSLGANSEIGLTEFNFSPAEGRLGLVVRMVRGVAAFVSGRIARLRPEAVRIETPASIVGVRGTHLVVRAEAP